MFNEGDVQVIHRCWAILCIYIRGNMLVSLHTNGCTTPAFQLPAVQTEDHQL